MTESKIVFLVDDDPVFSEMFRDHFGEDKNIMVFRFERGEDCLRHLKQNPDIIVLDYYLSTQKSDNQDGLEILKKIKEVNPSMPVIILSASHDFKNIADTLQSGAVYYVTKENSSFDQVEKIISNLTRNY